MRVDAFDFELPDELVALHPVEPRDSARMLVVDPEGHLADRRVGDLLDLLVPGDVLVINDTRVLPTELRGTRIRDENLASVSFNLHKRLDAATWLAFARPAKRLKPQDRVVFNDEPDDACFIDRLDATVLAVADGGLVTLGFDVAGAYLDEAIKAHGAMPLPPYIGAKRPVEARDRIDYQTVYAAVDGAVAAPTAGLHFTEKLLQDLMGKGVLVERVTLHVGAGTFLPMKVENTDDHVMHAEWGEITAAAAARIADARAKGGRVVAVGTTSLRLLESAARETGKLGSFIGETAIFITPGFKFAVVDVLMTNFHLALSTLFMIVRAFACLGVMSSAYAHAISSV